jgi:hypothetical protein
MMEFLRIRVGVRIGVRVRVRFKNLVTNNLKG